MRACIVAETFGQSSIWRVAPIILRYCAMAFKGAIITTMLSRNIQADESASLSLLLADKIQQERKSLASAFVFY